MIKILLITNKSDITTDFIVKKLTEKNQKFYRLNTEDLLSKTLLSFNFEADEYSLYDKQKKIKIDLKAIKSVYFRRPQLPHIDGNFTDGEKKFIINEISFWIEGLYKILQNAFWISSVYSIREAESKIFQLKLAKEIGFKIPESLITNNIDDAEKFVINNVRIIKPIKTGLIDDTSNSKVIFTNIFKNTEELHRIKSCPTYFQNFINKNADIRVTIVGEKIFAAAILSQEFEQTKVDWRNGENLDLEYKKINLPKHLEILCLKLMKKLNLNFGAIDFVEDEKNNYFFLEINPNGQWAWIENQLGYNISEEICNLLIKEL